MRITIVNTIVNTIETCTVSYTIHNNNQPSASNRRQAVGNILSNAGFAPTGNQTAYKKTPCDAKCCEAIARSLAEVMAHGDFLLVEYTNSHSMAWTLKTFVDAGSSEHKAIVNKIDEIGSENVILIEPGKP
ncbi:MAG: hypothetical protein HQL56_14130 [Magnetococcales bacterium]|nr:hypothetical protein [Magnetococcales bacterium]